MIMQCRRSKYVSKGGATFRHGWKVSDDEQVGNALEAKPGN
jgi:hypothetical protein